MARFDVYRSQSSGTLLVAVQADAHRQFDTCVVVPLLEVAEDLPEGLPRLHPCFEVEGTAVRMATHLIGATMRSDLGMRVGTLDDRAYEIVSALDVLLTGV